MFHFFSAPSCSVVSQSVQVSLKGNTIQVHRWEHKDTALLN